MVAARGAVDETFVGAAAADPPRLTGGGRCAYDRGQRPAPLGAALHHSGSLR